MRLLCTAVRLGSGARDADLLPILEGRRGDGAILGVGAVNGGGLVAERLLGASPG